ncbi:MAG: ion transporter [Flavobacteriaceae bacterium]|nr:ion transporter [Flavobacteriaceae bacterium]
MQHWRKRIHEIIYESDTREGRLFDIILIGVITMSIMLVMLESVKSLDAKYHAFFYYSEWVITVLFTLEYVLRILTVNKPAKYIFSFYGIIDLLSTLPMYISIFFGGAHALLLLRAVRLLRIFTILKLGSFVGASQKLRQAIYGSRFKIMVFLSTVIILCIIIGTIMYVIEGEASGFTSIPVSMYWAIVTLTTVGYGDIAPQTPLGQFLASLVMVMGYGIIAIPTGIVTSEFTKQDKDLQLNTQSCPNCAADKHRNNAEYCYSCGSHLHN